MPAESAALQRLLNRARALRLSGLLKDPVIVTSDALTAFLAALGEEIDCLHVAVTELRQELSGRSPSPGVDHTHDPLEHAGVGAGR